ncbi:MAG: carbonic anhydrase family protein [Cellvibrionaceae bacterium]|nr:carbonic anhydrase family protein [Cellvibrionaceae bacterium]
MKALNTFIFYALGVCVSSLPIQGAVAAGDSWSYDGKAGPSHWASLTPEYGACAGKNQSPINLNKFVEADLKNIQFEYTPGGTQIVNNGHSIQINYNQGSDIILDGQTFNLLQFHFHAPSENWIDGVSYPMEGHFVHADQDGNLAVVAVMFAEGQEGEANPALNEFWKFMPSHMGNKHTLHSPFNAESLLPSDRAYYRFNGSLTTPPCTEGVRWIVMKHPVTASARQINHFKKVMRKPNNRPIQQANARVILE